MEDKFRSPRTTWHRTALAAAAFTVAGMGAGWGVAANAGGAGPVSGDPGVAERKVELRQIAERNGFAGTADATVAYLADCLQRQGQAASYYEEAGHGRMAYGGDPALITGCFKQLEVLG